MSMEETFTSIYRSNGWGGRESLSGSGSDLVETVAIRKALPKLLKKYDIDFMLDLPCGDFNWMSHIDLGKTKYLGMDIVPELIRANKIYYPFHAFEVGDATRTVLPMADLVLCRDMLGHLSDADMRLAIRNIALSGSKYLLTTTFPEAKENRDIETGGWRPVNIELLLGEPIELIDEDYEGKKLGLWSLNLKTVKLMNG